MLIICLLFILSDFDIILYIKEICADPATGPIEPSEAIPRIIIGHGTLQISLDLQQLVDQSSAF